MSSPSAPPGVGPRVRRSTAPPVPAAAPLQTELTQAVNEASKLNQNPVEQSNLSSGSRAGPRPPMMAPREPSKPRSLTPGRSTQISSEAPQRPHSLREPTAGIESDSVEARSEHARAATAAPAQPQGLSARMQEAIAAASSEPPPPEPPLPESSSSAHAPHAQQESARSRLDVRGSSLPGQGAPVSVPSQLDSVYSREQKLQDTLAKANATLAEFRARVGAPAPSQQHQGSPQWHPHPATLFAPHQHSNGSSPWQQQPRSVGSPASQPYHPPNHVINWGPSSPGSVYGMPPQPSPQQSPGRSPATKMPGARILFSSSGSAHSPSPWGGAAFPPAPPGQTGPHAGASSTTPHWPLAQHSSPPKHNNSTRSSSRSSSPDSSAAAASAVLEGQLAVLRKQLKAEQDARKDEHKTLKPLQDHVDGIDTRAADTLQALVAQLSTAGVQVRLPSDKQPPNAVGIKGGGDDLPSAVLSVPQLPLSTSEAVVAALAAERARFGAREAAIRDEMSASSRWYQDMARRAEEDVVATRDKATMDALDAEATASESRKAFEQRVRQRSMHVVEELRAEIHSLEEELEAAHSRHTSLEEQVRSQFESHCRSFENRLRGRASAAISAIRHASEVAAQHHYTRQLRAARDAIKSNLLQQSVAGIVDVTAVDKLFADLALMPMLSAAPATQPSGWPADTQSSATAARRLSNASSVGGAADALQAVMLDSQAAASEALQFFSDTLHRGPATEAAVKGAAAAPVGAAPHPSVSAPAPNPVAAAEVPSFQSSTQAPPVTPPKPPSVTQEGGQQAAAPAPAAAPTLYVPAAAPRPPPPRPPGVSVPSTSSAQLKQGAAGGGAVPPRPPPGVGGKPVGRTSTNSVTSVGASVASKQSSSSEEQPLSPPPAAASLPRHRGLAARSKPAAIRTRGQSPANQRKEQVLKMLRADASSFRRSPSAGTRKVIHDEPLNPTRARRLRQSNSPSPTGKALGNKIRSRVFK